MKLIYIGHHPAVTSPVFGVAEREGAPVDVPSEIAPGLIARGDFIKYEPEPKRNPVQTKASP